MNQTEFIAAIKEVVLEDSVKALQDLFMHPPGRKPTEKAVTMSAFYNGLSDGEKSILIAMLNEALEMGIFSFLCVLDGVRSIEDGKKGKLELFYSKDDEHVLLNDPATKYLHDIFNEREV